MLEDMGDTTFDQEVLSDRIFDRTKDEGISAHESTPCESFMHQLVEWTEEDVSHGRLQNNTKRIEGKPENFEDENTAGSWHTLVLRLASTWGHARHIGLTEVQIFDEFERRFHVDPHSVQLVVDGRDITEGRFLLLFFYAFDSKKRNFLVAWISSNLCMYIFILRSCLYYIQSGI